MQEPKKASGSDVLTLDTMGRKRPKLVDASTHPLAIADYGSKLAKMFSGKWNLYRREPDLFIPLLDFRHQYCKLSKG
jgi:hypothetical protein